MTANGIERAVSTWSLHRTLGRFTGTDSAVYGGTFLPLPDEPPQATLLELLPDIAKSVISTWNRAMRIISPSCARQ